LNDASVDEALAGTDLADRDLVNLTTSTPVQARAEWARERGAHYLDRGIMAVPPMIGVPEAGSYVFYSGSRELFERHHETLGVPAGTTYVGKDAGFACVRVQGDGGGCLTWCWRRRRRDQDQMWLGGVRRAQIRFATRSRGRVG
jgi:hypothetical protein